MNKYVVTNPATGVAGTSVPLATNDEVVEAIGAADRAHTTLRNTTTVAERAAMIHRVAELHTERREQLAGIIVREMGKPLEQALGEVDFSAAIYDYYASNGEAFLADESIELMGGEGTAFIRNASMVAALIVQPARGTTVTTTGNFGWFERDSTLRASFDHYNVRQLTGTVRVILVQPDGKIIVAGAFTNQTGLTNSNLARLNRDGSFDSSYKPLINGEVLALALQADGKLILA
eukprot:gene44885-54901_t